LILTMVDWDICQESLGVCFRRESLLEQAFVHTSYCNENPELEYSSNERLEFLGDAVLNLVVTDKLYKEFPEMSEGELTEIRASLVCRDTLAGLASSLELGDWLLLGRGEELSGGRAKASNLANAVEALIGALYLDQGIGKTRRFILKQLKRDLEEIKMGKIMLNYKALVQELIQGEGKQTPVYHLVEAIGPEHDKQFTAEIRVDGQALGVGMGGSKKVAESRAARAAWEKLRCSHGQTRL
jgi:ribonuclease-3